MIGHSFLLNIFLDYKIEWPLTEIFNQDIIKSYNHLLLFFLYLNHVRSQLLDCWIHMKYISSSNYAIVVKLNEKFSQFCSNSKSNKRRSNLTWIQLNILRREYQHIIDSLMRFFNHEILNVSYSKLLLNIRNADNIHCVHEIHDRYVNHLLENCFLKEHQSDLRQRLHRMLELMIDFQQRIKKICLLMEVIIEDRIGDEQKSIEYEGRVDIEIHELMKGIKIFGNVSQFVFRILGQINRTRVSHLIDHLLLQIDFNHFYKTM